MRVSSVKYCGFEEKVLKTLKVFNLKVIESVNVDSAPAKCFVMIDNSIISSLDDDTQKILKVSTHVLTDDAFSLKDYVEKITPLIEADKEKSFLAKTSFITLPAETFASLQESVRSQKDDLVKSSEILSGFKEDEFTTTLSKLACKGVSCVTSNLRQLIDLKRPESEPEKDIFDVIEERVIAIVTDGQKGDELDKKKKDV